MLLSNSGGDSHMLISNSGGGQEEGGVGGSRTSVVFVQATRPVERDEEFFANYGTGFRFPLFHSPPSRTSGVSVICVDVMLRRHVAS
jgi:hypothetical protein